MKLLLASSSPYRRQLLTRLGLDFITASPPVDEQHLPAESAPQLVRRLALEKAQSLAARYPQHLIIGSDQAAELKGQILGKPGGHAAACAQLQAASGQRVNFHTGLCLLNAASGDYQLEVVDFAVEFRQLSAAEIERYLQQEPAYDCAGSFKSEGLGITLFKAMHGEDPSALIGLPLIRLSAMLRTYGVPLP